MIGFWHSPFERFVHIDSDAVCWGDFLRGVPWADYDLIYNEPHEVITDHIQATQYFDPERVFPNLPVFPWRGRPFFNTGVFTARRGVFDLEEYLDLLAFERRQPGAFLCGDQGIFNFMAFRHISAGRLRARDWPFHAVVPVIPVDQLRQRFRLERRVPIIQDGDRRLIHWAGPKPYLTRRAAFTDPMSHYRIEHLRRRKSPLRMLGRLALVLEEIHFRVTGHHGGSYIRAAKSKMRWLVARSGLRRLAAGALST